MANLSVEGAHKEIDLKILTNTARSTILYPNLPVSTTIGQLKAKIQHDLAPSPALDRLRLIYLGRVLPNQDDTLLDIFGTEYIKQSREQTIHLVVPDQGRIQPDQASRSSTVPPPQPHTNPFRAQPQAPNRPQSQPQHQQGPAPGMPQAHVPGHHHHHHPHHIVQGGTPPFPPEFADLITRQLAAAQNGIGNNAGHPQQATGDGRQTGFAQGNVPIPGLGTDPNNFFQQVIAQQQQQRAAAGDRGAGTEQPRSGGTGINGGMSGANANGTQSPHPPHAPGNVHIHREGIAPNGAHWSVSVDQIVHRIPRNANAQAGARTPTGFPGNPFHRPPTVSSSELIRHGSPLSSGPQTADIHAATTRMREMRDAFDAPNRGQSEAGGMDEIDHLRHIVNVYESYHTRVERSLNSSTPQNPVSRLASSSQPSSRPSSSGNPNGSIPGNNQTIHTREVPSPGITASTGPADGMRSDSSDPQVFLIRGPDGPHAILLSPSGNYGTGGFSDSLRLNLSNIGFPSNRSNQSSAVQAPGASSGPSGLPAPPRVHAAQAANPANAPPPNQPAPNELPNAQAVIRQRLEARLDHLRQQRDQRRNAPNAQNAQNGAGMALAGHVWLAVRLLFFLYMFSGGSGWRRPLMMIGTAIVIYLFQLGVFNAPVDILRRHFENLLPLPEERRREEQARRIADEGNRAQEAGLTPEQAAQRLAQDHNNENVSWIRDQLRLVERAMALFVASLWPGLGERMVATREARLRQQREEEEQREREAEAEAARQAEQEASAAPDTAQDEDEAWEDIEDDKGKGKARAYEAEAASSSVDPTPSGSQAASRNTFQTSEQ